MDACSDLGLGPAAYGTHPAATRDHPTPQYQVNRLNCGSSTAEVWLAIINSFGFCHACCHCIEIKQLQNNPNLGRAIWTMAQYTLLAKKMSRYRLSFNHMLFILCYIPNGSKCYMLSAISSTSPWFISTCFQFFVVVAICFSKKICPRASWTLPSGVDAPEVTPITISRSGWFSSVVRNFSVTISPSIVRWVIVLSALMQSARLMWNDRTPACWGISSRCAFCENFGTKQKDWIQ